MNKKGSHFRAAMVAVTVAVFVFSAAFLTENSSTPTGFVVSEESVIQSPTKFIESHSLSQLAPGNYYVDYDGIIYWIDDSARPAIGRLRQEENRGRQFYISKDGTVNFV